MSIVQRKPKLKAVPALDGKTGADLEIIRNHGPQPVCFFNNKGGVGKTTLVANLAAELALNYGCRVLVVDADPQCNLSQYVLSDEDFIKIYESDSDI